MINFKLYNSFQTCKQCKLEILNFFSTENWNFQRFYQIRKVSALTKSESGSIYCSICINPHSKDFSVLTALARKHDRQRRAWCRIRRQQPPEVNQTTSDLATSNSADGTPASEGRMDEEDWHVMKARRSLRRSGAFSRQKSQRRHSSPDAEKQTPSKLQKREQQVSSLKTSHT